MMRLFSLALTLASALHAGCRREPIVVSLPHQRLGYVTEKKTVEFEISNPGAAVEVLGVEKSCQCIEVRIPEILKAGKTRVGIVVDKSKGHPSMRRAVAHISHSSGILALQLDYGGGQMAGLLPSPILGSSEGAEVRLLIHGQPFNTCAYIYDGETVLQKFELPESQILIEKQFRVPYETIEKSKELRVVVKQNEESIFESTTPIYYEKGAELRFQPNVLRPTGEGSSVLIVRHLNVGGELSIELDENSFAELSDITKLSSSSFRCMIRCNLKQLAALNESERQLSFGLVKESFRVASGKIKVELVEWADLEQR